MPGRAWSRAAWAAIGTTALSIALTAWWLALNRAMPYGDAAEHLYTAFSFHDELSSGDLLGPLKYSSYYPPATPLVGAIGIFVGGRNVAAPVMAENLVYTTLLALAVYRTAQLAYGERAAVLAVAFALGSPLIVEQFHVFMIDAPEAALVAAEVWLILASERFARTEFAVAAGLIAGIGVISKQTFPLYICGLLLVVLLRGGGWRNRRGIAAFLLAGFVVASPWYIAHLSDLSRFGEAALPNPTVPPAASPPLLSLANLSWYFWALANGLLFVPLLLIAAVGLLTETTAAARRRSSVRPVPELVAGGALAWLAITVMPHHDVRYTMPLIVFIAVLGTAWIVRLRPALRTVVTAALALAIVAATLGATFGVGPSSSALLPGNRDAPRGEGVPPLNSFTLYSNHNFLVSGPRRAGDLLGVFKAMHRDGVVGIAWDEQQAPEWDADYNVNGLVLLAKIAQIPIMSGTVDVNAMTPDQAIVIHRERVGLAGPCARLPDGSGVWIRRGNPNGPDARDYCPIQDPPYYGP